MLRWKPLLGTGKKEIACERAGGEGGGRGGRVPPRPPRPAHQPIYGSAFQQGHSKRGGSVEALFSRVNSGESPVWFVWGRLICSEDPLNCLLASAAAAAVDLHCDSTGGLVRTLKTCEWTEQPVDSSCFRPPAPTEIHSITGQLSN